MADWNGSGPTPGLTLTDEQVLALAKHLHALTATTLSSGLSTDAEYVDLLAARARISVRADAIIHESRASRR